jgi:hypothetical protein
VSAAADANTIITVVSTAAGSVAASLSVLFAILSRKRKEAQRVRDAELRSERTITALQIDTKIHQIVTDAVTKVTEPLQAELHENTKATTEVNLRLTKVEAQFGPNGGGLREKVNTISDDLTDVRIRLARVEGQGTRLRASLDSSGS